MKFRQFCNALQIKVLKYKYFYKKAFLLLKLLNT